MAAAWKRQRSGAAIVHEGRQSAPSLELQAEASTSGLQKSFEQTVADVVQQLEAQQERISQLKEAQAKREQAVLIGQVAYTIGMPIATYVFKRHRLKSLPEMRSMARHGELREEELARYQEVEAFFTAKGLNMQRIIRMAKGLRSERLDVAHGTAKQLDEVTADEIMQWARANGTYDMEDVEALLQASRHFSLPGKPLVSLADGDFAAAINSAVSMCEGSGL